MFGTIIIDSYNENEKELITNAIKDSCSSGDHWGWSSVGIYCFWNYETKEILYIGLATDLAHRFKQHNGLINCTASGSKKDKIDEYFFKNERLGYSIFVQSPLNQIGVHTNSSTGEFDIEKGHPFNGLIETIKKELKELEGILIGTYFKINKKLPEWNKINGSIAGQYLAKKQNPFILKALTNSINHPVIAKSTLRELLKNPYYCGIEVFLHSVRCTYLRGPDTFESCLDFYIENSLDGQMHKENLDGTGYLNKILKI